MQDKLTPRKLEVLKLVASGYSNKKIMKQLWISRATLQTHLFEIYEIIGLFYEDCSRETSTRRVQAALYYWQNYNNGLIDLKNERV